MLKQLDDFIIYEDAALLALNKPADVTVNNSQTSSEDTVQNYLIAKYHMPVGTSTEEDSGDVEEDEFSSRSGLVHRIDKATSGVLLIAKNEKVFTALQAQFKARTVKKTYCAVTHGVLADKRIEVDAPIARNPTNRMKYGIVRGGKEAVSIIETVGKFNVDAEHPFTSVYVYPKTGRTHQIRVHLSALGHPIAGDPIYCTKKQYAFSFGYFNRLMLHAYKITFVHPETQESMELKAELPEVFNSCLKQSVLS